MIFKNSYRFFQFALFLIVSAPLIIYADDPFITRLEVEQPNEFGAMNLKAENGSIKLSVSNPANNSGFDLSIKSGATRFKLSPKRFFSENQKKLIKTYPAPKIGEELCWFTFKRTERSWTAYINNQEVIRMPQLWQGMMHIKHPESLMPSDDDIDDYTQRLGSFTFEDNFLVPAGSDFPPRWEVMSGNWKLHSVTGTVSGSSGGYKLARQPKPEKSPNFYTLEGGGTNAMVLTGEPFYSHYEMRASVQHNSGTNGIVFLASEQGGYIAFTARTDYESSRLVLDLWQQPQNQETPPIYLKSVQTELPAGQWLLLEVKLLDNFIICMADHIPVIKHRAPLPAGGRFGLFTNMSGDEVTRFDDISASTHDDILIDTPSDINFITRPDSQQIRSVMRHNICWAYFPPGQKTNLWQYGTAGSAPLRQESRAVATKDDFSFGLLCGKTTENTPFYRFTCNQSNTGRIYKLDYITTTNITLIDSFATTFTSNRVDLTLDALTPGKLKAYADNKLVCLTHPSEQPGGILGVCASSTGDFFFSAPDVTSKDDTLSERFEKNPLYVNDPYMKHWASPEGQWVTFEDDKTWFKGDLTGAFTVQLPIINNTELHLCIPENSSNGLCRIAVSNNFINLYTEASPTQSVFSINTESIPKVMQKKSKIQLFTVGVEDHLIWISNNETLLAQTHLSKPMQGRRMRIEGMNINDLKHTLVKRKNVFDTLFNESLYNWSISGGRWEVVNRFYCEPTWSHMNGESSDSLASLWSKYIFEGDFSIEFYAGMRMGWYARPGDLNLTIMSKANLTSDGYTAIATGWDPDHSQLYSRLMRNGKVMDISTKYLVPRTREGLTRRGYQPLIGKGRDYHGAWYGMQLRRIGKNLQYIYDNEQVFNVVDENPLQNGSLGIWTYRNSMMVARIKIAAEHIKPRPFKFHSITPGVKLSYAPAPTPDSGIRVNQRVAQPLAPEYWESFDTVSHPVVNFRKFKSAKPEMFASSLMGAGSFLVKCNLPPANPDKLLGWRFEIARHPDTKINFEFTTIKNDPKKGVLPKQGWTYILSGTTERRGPRKIAGQSKEILPSDRQGKALIWTPVKIWIPSEVIRKNMAVQIEGFGNLQPSEVQAGLKGNPPKAWFAIREFREIHRGIPVISGPPEKRKAIDDLTKIVNSLPPGELQMVKIPASLDPTQPVIEWAVPEMANFGLIAKEDNSIPGSILISPTHPWPSALLPPKKILIDAQPAPFESDGNNIRVLIPLELIKPQHMTLTAELSDGRLFRQVVPMRMNETTNFPPTLLSLEMPKGGIKTFEKRPQNPLLHKLKADISFDYSDPNRGGTLKISNNGHSLRLSALLTKQINLIDTPIIQFKYKGDPMSKSALSFGSSGFTFSEHYKRNIRYSGQTPAVMNEHWHTWMGMPSDGIGKFPLKSIVPVKSGAMSFASKATADQSGLHSYLQIDDIATGPAVGPQRPFAFKADYIDQDGIAAVTYAIITGDKPYDSRNADEIKKITWISAHNSEVIEPDISNTPDGIHHLIVRAKDNRDAWSEPADIPFALDRKAPLVSHKISTIDKYNGSVLNLNISDLITPPVINDLTFRCNGTELDMSKSNGSCLINNGQIKIQMDWIWSLRNLLPKIADGTELTLAISGIYDSAGNHLEPYTIKIPVDKKNDQYPPTILPSKKPSNAYIYNPTVTDINKISTRCSYFQHKIIATPEGSVLQLTIPKKCKNKPYICNKLVTSWNPEKHPFLAISFKNMNAPDKTHKKAKKKRSFKIRFGTNLKKDKKRHTSITLDLFDPEQQQFITGKISPVTNTWNDVIINIRDFMRSQSDQNKAAPISWYYIYPSSNKPGTSLQMRSLSIMAPWTKKNILNYQAYDLNGIKYLRWQGGDLDTRFTPAEIKPHTPDDNWMKIRLSDGVDNKSNTFMIPLMPALSQTVKEDE